MAKFLALAAMAVVAVHAEHYGDPNVAPGCARDEVKIQIQGISGNFCSPQCNSSGSCPTDVPSGVTASPACALSSSTGAHYCALLCSPSTDEASLRAGDAQCGKNASCKAIQGTGLCTYDDMSLTLKFDAAMGSKEAQADKIIKVAPKNV